MFLSNIEAKNGSRIKNHQKLRKIITKMKAGNHTYQEIVGHLENENSEWILLILSKK